MKAPNREAVKTISVIAIHITVVGAAILFLLHGRYDVVLPLLLVDVLYRVTTVLRYDVAIFHLDHAINRMLEDRMKTRERLETLSHRSNRVMKIRAIVDACCEYTVRQVYDSRAEYAALQSQINPHFLYNTLDAIRAQAIVDGNRDVGDMIEVLALFFRYCVGREGELVTLREELANAENYMAIHRYRFGDRYRLMVDVDPEDECVFNALVPRLIIQPIVENAMYHGLKDVLEDGEISITITSTNCRYAYHHIRQWLRY